MLNAVRVRSVVYCRSDLGAPWGFRVPESPQAKFHLILRGPASVSLDSGDSAALEAGDLVLLPHGSGHVMKDGRPRGLHPAGGRDRPSCRLRQ